MDDDMRQELLGRIAARRASIDRYLGDVRPRSGRLNTVSIISSAIAGISVAGPAAGGEAFTEGVANALSLETGSDVWGPLCLLALIANVVALITTQLHKTQDLSARVSAA